MKTFALLLLLTACSSRPAFRKGDGGYSVRDTPVPEILELTLDIPPGTKDTVRTDYLLRAAGEECEARHFPFFDVGPTATGAKVFCYAKSGEAASLGATYTLKGSDVRVEDTLMGRFSPLRASDVIRKVGGRDVHDLGDLKESLFLARRKGDKRVSVLVERSEIPLSLDSPVTTDAAYSAATLKDLRSKLP